jgi:hypothetical protein
LKWPGIAFRALGGKEAIRMAKVQPMVMNTEAPSTKFMICPGVRKSSPPCIIPVTMTPNATITPII